MLLICLLNMQSQKCLMKLKQFKTMLQSEFYNHLHNIEMSCHQRPKQYRYGQMLYNASYNEFSKY